MKYGSPEYGRAWREKHKERLATERKQKYNDFWKPRRLRRSYWLNKYKMVKGCVDCGYNSNPVALDLDHVNPKEKRFTISHRLDRATIKSLIAEIRKCEVRCANCHRIKTLEANEFVPISRTT